MSQGRLRRVAPVAAAVAAGLGTLVVALVSPYEQGRYPLCPLFALTGLYCPACGGLRAVHDLAHLDIAGAWAMNPLLVLAVPVVFVVWLAWLARAWSLGGPGGMAQRIRVDTVQAAWIGLALFVAYGVPRNIPALESWLAPGGS